MSDDPNPGPGPWHAGERELQARIGAAERMADLGNRVIRRFLLDQHRAFYAQLPFIVAGSVDAEGDAWATLLCGQPGFLAAPTLFWHVWDISESLPWEDVQGCLKQGGYLDLWKPTSRASDSFRLTSGH